MTLPLLIVYSTFVMFYDNIGSIFDKDMNIQFIYLSDYLVIFCITKASKYELRGKFQTV